MMTLQAGRPNPLGVHFDGEGANVAVFSEHATGIELCLFSDDGRRETERLVLPERSGPVWHAYVPGLAPGARYGLRAHGPYAPEQGHRFNPNKLLLDPYARGPARTPCHQRRLPRLRSRVAGGGPFLFAHRQRAGHAKVRGDGARPAGAGRRAAQNTLVANRDLRSPPQGAYPFVALAAGGTARQLRGSCRRAGAGSSLSLGVTALELLPVHAFADDRWLLDKGLVNYWGYNSIAFFTLERVTSGLRDRPDSARRCAAPRRRARGDSGRGL